MVEIQKNTTYFRTAPFRNYAFLGKNMPDSYDLKYKIIDRFGNIGTITGSIVGCLKKRG